MPKNRTRFVYLCAFAHYTSGTLAISTRYHTLDHAIKAGDLDTLHRDLQDYGFRQAMVISFSLFDQPQD